MVITTEDTLSTTRALARKDEATALTPFQTHPQKLVPVMPWHRVQEALKKTSMNWVG